MKFAWMVLAAALRLSAATVDVSGAATELLNPGDALSFAIASWNYGLDAFQYGLPVYPTDIGFVFVSAPDFPLLLRAEIEASLGAADGSTTEASGAPLTFSPGVFSSAGYSGPVSTLQGSWQLSTAASQRIFGGSGALLNLRNLGPAITLGLAPYTLPQDLFVTLSGGGLSVGGLHGAVTFQESPMQEAPEPHSPALLMGGGVFLGLLVLQRSRIA